MSEAKSEEQSTSCVSASPCKDGHSAESWLAGDGACLSIDTSRVPLPAVPIACTPHSADLSNHEGLCTQQARVSVVHLMQSRSLGHRSLPGDCLLQPCRMLCALRTAVATVHSAMPPPVIATRVLDGRCSR